MRVAAVFGQPFFRGGIAALLGLQAMAKELEDWLADLSEGLPSMTAVVCFKVSPVENSPKISRLPSKKLGEKLPGIGPVLLDSVRAEQYLDCKGVAAQRQYMPLASARGPSLRGCGRSHLKDKVQVLHPAPVGISFKRIAGSAIHRSHSANRSRLETASAR